MNYPELVHGLELLPCAIRDGMLYIPHADGNWVSAAKLQPFSLKIIECWRAEKSAAPTPPVDAVPGEPVDEVELIAKHIEENWKPAERDPRDIAKDIRTLIRYYRSVK